MPCYVNLPVRWIHQKNDWLDWFLAGRIAPELGLDAASLALPDTWHERLAARFRDAGIACAVHLPFMGVDPGVADVSRVRAAREALRRGAVLAKIYGAAHMIGHPYYRVPELPGREDPVDPAWLERSLLAWPELPGIAETPLFLENTYETSPRAIATLAGALQTGGTGSVGVCFDLGHWHSFAGKGRPEDLDPWFEAYAPFALHLHLHDNDGSCDQHLGIGRGGVPFDAVFARLAAFGRPVTATLEPHDVEAFLSNIKWLEANPDAAACIGWESPRADAMPLDEIKRHIAVE